MLRNRARRLDYKIMRW
ncbi:protein YnaN [Escherichia coli]|nr:protein YnaN [Escherichia coli]MCQ4856778.1 protein YnaN [Escherichia coli]